MKMRANFSLAVLAFLPALVFATTPTINSVTGTLQTGQTLTIAGTNMNNETKTNWDSFFVSHPNAWSFEGTDCNADGYGNITTCRGTYDSSIKLLGSKSYKFNAQGASSNCPTGNLMSGAALDPAGGDANDYWVRAYVRWNLAGGGWPSSHIKMIDIQGSGSQYYFQPEATSNGTLPTQFNAVYDSTSHEVNIPSGQLQNNRWYVVEIHWKTNATPYIFDAWIDGVQFVSARPTTPGSMNYLLFGLINLCGTNSNFSLDHWVDGLAVATSRIYPSSVVEIGNSSDYATATKKYQPPVYISDGQVQIQTDLSSLGSGPYYLWVTNNSQERSQPYTLGAGGGGDTTPPVLSGGSPSGEQAYGTTSVNMQITTNENATCKYGTSDVTYASLPNTFSTTGSTSHSQSIATTNGGSYTYYVRCQDGSNNANTSSTVISWTVSSSPFIVFFSESYENTNFASRGWYDITSGTIDTTEYHSGSASLRCTYNLGGTDCTAPKRHKFTESDSVYLSYWVKYSSNFVGSGVGYHPHEFLFLTNLNGDYDGLAFDYLTLYLESHWSGSSSGTMQVGFQDGQNIDQTRLGQDLIGVTENRAVAGCNGSPSGYLGGCYDRGDGVYVNGVLLSTSQTFTTANKNTWNHVEAYYQLNSVSNGIGQANGIIRVWFNDSLVFERTNAILRTGQRPTMKLNQFIFGPWIGDGSPVIQTMWIDDLVVASARSEIITILYPPTNIRIISQ